MQGTNRSGIQCAQHPNQQVTNFCIHYECLRPLCPDCVQIHTKQHQKQSIQSWKHCVNKSAKNVKTTLDNLKHIYDKNSKYKGFKSADTVEVQNVKKLNIIKERVIELVNDIFNNHEQRLRSIIRTQYRIDAPDTTKLKLAIDQLQKILMKLGHASSVIPALKKSLVLDHQSLLNYFNDMKQEKKMSLNQNYVFQVQSSYNKLRNDLDGFVSLGSPLKQIQQNTFKSPNVQKLLSARNSYGEQSPFTPLKITQPDYFDNNCKSKLLHFFVPLERQLRILHIDQALTKQNWKLAEFQSKQQVLCYAKSIITPKGDIYLTGGSRDTQRSKQIYKYNQEKKKLLLQCYMKNERSSHAICYNNNCIYLIGGFMGSQSAPSRQCEVFRLDTQTCEAIAPLNTPSANSCATPFNNQYIFNFGGVENKIQGNNLIQMYSINNNRWIVVDIELPRNIPKLDLLSFSAAVQINSHQILVFGGYNDSQMQKPQRTCYTLSVNISKKSVSVKNYNTTPLAYAEGFWNNNPIIHQKKVYALQNITDQQDQLTALADDRRVVIFNGDRWI